MHTQVSSKAAILAVIIVLTFFVSWELYLRHNGIAADYDDGPELWAHNRAMVYEPANKATVFIGSSRIKYDLDIQTWESLTGTHAIQLAMVGSTPRPVLTNLANDTSFKGKLICDVVEVLFFSRRGLERPSAGLNYYAKQTPAQKVSFMLDKPLESRLVFLNDDHFALNSLLEEFHIQNRPGVYPFLDFPPGFTPNMFNRQNKMSADFIADTNQHNQVRAVWGLLKNDPTPPMSGKPLDSVMQSVKNDVAKIRARGGDVIFVRPPSSGFFLMAEHHLYPRKAYWDRLLAETSCKGIYYEDYPEQAKLDCPEFSHLTPTGAIAYTNSIVSILEKEKGWSFSAH